MTTTPTVTVGESGEVTVTWTYEDGSQMQTETWPDGEVRVRSRDDAWATWGATWTLPHDTAIEVAR